MTTSRPQTKVKKEDIPTPEVIFSELAFSQLELIIENDLTLKGKYLRLLISGKGCDGFSYSVGFTDWNDDDLMISIKTAKRPQIDTIQIIMDPFTAFYLQKCSVDYIQDFANNNEGFVVTNHNQDTFAGKFWRKDETKIPPTVS